MWPLPELGDCPTQGVLTVEPGAHLGTLMTQFAILYGLARQGLCVSVCVCVCVCVNIWCTCKIWFLYIIKFTTAGETGNTPSFLRSLRFHSGLRRLSNFCYFSPSKPRMRNLSILICDLFSSITRLENLTSN